MKIVFVGPISESIVLSGGNKRFREAFESFEMEEAVLIEQVRKLKGIASRGNLYVAFDERYLLKLLPFLLLKIPVIFFPRGNKIVHYEGEHSSFRLICYRLIFSFLYSKCRMLVFQTQTQYLEFKEMYGYDGRYAVLPNNLNASWMEKLAKQAKEEKYLIKNKSSLNVGFLGGLNERKGFIVAYEALKIFVENKSVVFNVAGDIAEKFIDYDVKAFGRVFDDDLASFYESNDIIIIPSRYDSFPNVLLEALVIGCIPLITRMPITEDILGKDSQLLFDRNTESIAEIINRIQTDEDFVIKLARECAELNKKYTFDWQAKVREIILSEVV